MDTIFVNSKNSETSDPHRLLLILSGKINLIVHQLISIFGSPRGTKHNTDF